MANKNKLRWGFRLHVLPDFAPNYLQKLTEDMIRKNELRLPASVSWTIEADHDLVELASEFCYIKTIDIMTLFPGHLVPNDRLLMKYGRLIDYTISQIQIRFYVIQQFNKMVRDSLPYINIACENNDSTLARNLCDLRGLIFQTIKTSWLEDALAKSNYSGKINVAVEKLVSTLSNSEWIQGIVNAIGSLLEGINSILNNSLGMQIVFSAISMIVGQMLVTKSKQVAITMKNHQLEKSINKELIKQRILEKKNAIEAKKTAIAKQASAIATQEELIANIKSGKITSTSLLDAEATLARLKQEQAMNESNLKLDQMELNNLQKDALALGMQNNTVVDNIGIGVSSIGGGILSAITGSQA